MVGVWEIFHQFMSLIFPLCRKPVYPITLSLLRAHTRIKKIKCTSSEKKEEKKKPTMNLAVLSMQLHFLKMAALLPPHLEKS